MISLVFVSVVLGVVLTAPTEDLELPILGIVGGNIADQAQFNYQISLQYFGSHICGGTLYSTNIVITAAHCTQNKAASSFTVRVGSAFRGSGGQVHLVERVIDHPSFNFQSLNNDVAVVKLRSHVKLAKNVGTIPLATQEPAANTQAKVSGWGLTKEGGSLSTTLLYAQISIFDRNYCRRQTTSQYSSAMICGGRKTGGIDGCQGDSGGPLVAGGRLVGVVSWGIGCARPGNPGVYTNVAQLKSWIEGKIRELTKA